jgi:hypothetical protein
VARLRVSGARALPRLAAFLTSDAPSDARAHALAALEGMTDPQAVELACAALGDPDTDVVVAALGVLRGWVTQESGTRLLETVTALAVDATKDARVRLAALDALSDLPEQLIKPIRAQAPPPEQGGPPLDNPDAARTWVEAHGRTVGLSQLHDAVKAFRDQEAAADTAWIRAAWLESRAATHRVLAQRGSRLALYDAKDTCEAARSPLPAGFLEAMRLIGDTSCLEPLAVAWSRSRDPEWRMQLSATAREIVRRAGIDGRSAVVRRLRAAHRGFA